MYVVWCDLSAQSGCRPNVRTAWAASVQKIRPEKLLMDPNGSVCTKMFHLPDVQVFIDFTSATANAATRADAKET